MTPESYQRASELYQQAREVPAPDREAWVARACGGDAPLERLVRSMLRADEQAPAFLDPAAPGLGRLALEAVLERGGADLPARIGSYRILSRLGVGGMGVVYEAEQDHPRRRVALKVVRPGLIAPAVVSRFNREVEIAGRLHHPGIAHIHEAGTYRPPHGDEAPFFSMEFIEGLRIDAYCREARLDPRARVELFVRVCDAVAYAHANGVVHRDLKPGNILVDVKDPAGPAPKVLDFGVARLSDGAPTTLATETGQVIGTLAYMSPEQVAGRAVDPRSDLYSLGVVLYELLADRSPYRELPGSVADAVRIVCDTDITRLGVAAPALRGDLETILGKALERDPARRYAGVAELASDLRRFLRDEPIAARPPSTWYHIQKFARRNRVLVSAVSAAFMALAAGLATSTALWITAASARDQASREAARLRVVRDFVRQDLMGAASPDLLGANATVLKAIDRAAGAIDARFANEPEYAGLLHLEVGTAYAQLGQDDKARPSLERAVALLSSTAGPESLVVLDAQAVLLDLVAAGGDLDGAEARFRELARTAERRFGRDAEVAMSIQTQLGSVLHMKGAYAESEKLLRDAAERQLRSRGPDYLPRFLTLNQLGAALAAQKRYQEAYDVDLEVQRGHDRLKPDHPDTVATLNELATMCLRLGKRDEYEAYLKRALELADRVLPRDSMRRAIVLGSYGSSMLRAGRFDEAEPVSAESLRILRGVLGMDTFQTLLALERLACVHASQGRAEQTRADLEQIPERADVAMHVRIRVRVASAHARGGDHAEALALFEQTRAMAVKAYGEANPAVANCELEHAEVLAGLGRRDEAAALLRAAADHAGDDQALKAKAAQKLETLGRPAGS